ncbi:MAG: rod shape-determining protein MreD [Pseudomonadota bacterium]
MKVPAPHGSWVIVLSLIIALMLSIMPLPEWATVWRPEWAAMTLIYWCSALPHRVGIAAGWTTGLAQDVLKDAMLGQHALGFCLIAYIAVRQHRRMELITIWQQTILVAILVLITQIWNAWVRSVTGQPVGGWGMFYPVLTSGILWFWVCIILRDIQHKLKVS